MSPYNNLKYKHKYLQISLPNKISSSFIVYSYRPKRYFRLMYSNNLEATKFDL